MTLKRLLLAVVLLSSLHSVVAIDGSLFIPEQVEICNPETYSLTIANDGSPADNLAVCVRLPDGFYYAGNSRIRFRGRETECAPTISSGSLRWHLTEALSSCRYVVINEFEQNPDGPDGGNEWVELFNPGTEEINLAGWKLVDSYYGKSVAISSENVISPGSFLTLPWSNGTLINSRQVGIVLYDSSDREVDRSLEGKDEEDDERCWARNPNGKDLDQPSDWTFQASTSGSHNGGACFDLYSGESIVLWFDLTAGCEARPGQALSAEISSSAGSLSVSSPSLDLSRANLSLSLVPDRFEVASGDRVSWEIEIYNQGNGTAHDVLANLTLGRGLEPESLDSPGGCLNWSYSALSPGGKEVVHLRARALDAVDYSTAMQVVWGCGPCQQLVLRSDLDQRTAIQKLPDSSAPLAIGDSVGFRIVANLPKGAKNLWINDSISSGLIYDQSSFVISGAVVQRELTSTSEDGSAGRSWFLGDLGSAKRIEISYRARVVNIIENQAGTILNGKAACMSWLDEEGPHIDSDSAGEIAIAEPDLMLEKSVSSSAGGEGSLITYTIALCHGAQSSSTAFDVDLRDQLPPGLQYCPGSARVLSGPAADFEDGPDLCWHLDAVSREWVESSKIIIKYNATMAEAGPGQVLENTARLSWSSASGQNPHERGGSGGLNDYFRTASAAVNSIRLSISKSASPDPVSVGEFLTYKLSFQNQGSVKVRNVTITDRLDPGVEMVASNPPPFANHTWFLPLLSPDGPHEIEIQVKVRNDLRNGTLLENRYSIECEGHPQVAGVLLTEVLNRTRLQVNKTAAQKSVRRGEEIFYQITVCNGGGERASNVTVEDILDSRVEQVYSWPSQTAPGIWHIGSLEPGECARIELVVRVPRTDVAFSSRQGVSGTGFANVFQDFRTAEEPYLLTNRVYVSSDEGPMLSDSEKVLIVGDAGTGLSIRDHGSGSCAFQENLRFLSANKSIAWDQNMSAAFEPVGFPVPGMEAMEITSPWARSVRAENGVTGIYLRDAVRYASRLKAGSRVFLDQNGSEIDLISDLEGQSQLQLRKKSPFKALNPANLSFSASESYLGRILVSLSVQEQGQSLHWSRSASGWGLVAADRKIGTAQGSSEAGAGIYSSSEQIRTETSYMSKELELASRPVSLGPPFPQLGKGMDWREEMWSQSKDSYVGEAYSTVERLRKKTVFGGLNEMESDSEFSGKSSFRASSGGKENQSTEVDQVLAGDYHVKRKILLKGVSRFDRPHLNLSLEGRLLNETVAGYRITILNDGNSALGPVHVKALFPAGSEFLNTSHKPYEMSPNSSSWTLTHLSIGTSLILDLVLDISRSPDPAVMCISASGGYGDQWVRAENCTALGQSWLGCCPVAPPADLEYCSDSGHCLATLDEPCACASENWMDFELPGGSISHYDCFQID
ncbi:MAG: DUF11 domain-containing protein [Methanotrichaceae archaeon]|nr:DUF11 domain-containing protein [Methanotrichaceae archaeon]